MQGPSASVISRRRLIGLSVTAAGSALLVACGQSPAAATTSATAPATVSTTAPATVSTTAPLTTSATASATTTTTASMATTTAAPTTTSVSTTAAPSTTNTVASTVAAAANSAQATGTKAITWSCYNLGDARIKAFNDTWQMAEKATGVTINPVWTGGADYWTKAQAAFAGGVAPADIMVNQDNWVVNGGLSGLFLDLAAFMRRDKMDPTQFYTSGLDEWAWKGKQWALPFQEGGEAVFYNKNIFDRKGVPYPKKDWTYDDLLAAARQTNDPANKAFGIDIGDGRSVPQGMSSYMLGYGGKVLNAAKDQALYGDDPKSIAGAQYAVDFVTKWQYGPTAEALKTLPKGKQPFDVGMVAIEINDFYRWADIKPSVGIANVGLAPMPKGPSGVQSAEVSGNAWSILSLSKAQDAAWSALSWTLSKEGLLNTPQLQALGWPSIIWAANSPQWMDQFKGTTIKDVSDVWATGGHSILPLPEGDKAWSVMQKPLDDAFGGKLTVTNAMQQSANDLNALFSQRPAAWK
jgi:multiple sugar transport system substrate-binding protein